MTSPPDDSPATLTDGAWRFDPWKRIQVWVPAPQEVAVEHDVHHLIACLRCRARVDQSCRTKTGAVCSPHAGRLAPRLCPCGASLLPKRQLCEPCARESELNSKRAWNQRNPKRPGLATVTAISAGWAGDEDEEGAA